MQKFLQQIADYYIDRGTDLSQCCFIFPNKRSGMFLHKYIIDRVDKSKPAFLPRFTTMSNFMSVIDIDATPASQAELLFILYKAYCKVLVRHKREEQIHDFDSFVYWGDMMLHDFDDIDAFLVDPDQLFLNLKREKEISANYLTQPQREAVKQIWGEVNLRYDVDRFWNHIPDASGQDSPSSLFINLWEILGEVYSEFKAMLLQSTPALTYSGAIYRNACNIIREMSADDFDSEKYIFVGFNHLSTSQIEIFRRMKNLGIAEFFWDISSPEFYRADGSFNLSNKAVRFVSKHSEQFPMPDDFCLCPIQENQKIEITAVPSSMAQTKVVSRILSGMFKDSDDEKVNKEVELFDTAVVLPDENLLLPMLYSLPEEVDRINITMGLPYNTTPFAALFSTIISMQMRAREIRGKWHFYFDDVVQVLSHPHIRMLEPTDTLMAVERIQSTRLYNIDVEEFSKQFPTLSWLLEPVRDMKDIVSIRAYMTRLIENLTHRLEESESKQEKKAPRFYERNILEAYRENLIMLCDMIESYGITVQGSTFFTLIERTLRQKSINLSGTPLQGLQVMGVLETRSLDFSNLMILSMNERTFPRRMYVGSLIPNNLRRGYNLPTIDTQEADYAYHFYRLISRAKNVHILYDSRTQSGSSGEMSRYLQQLNQLHKQKNISFTDVNFSTSISDSRVITIHKTPEVIAQLHRFYPGGDLNISASAMKAYRKCPLMFYLEFVCQLRDNSDVVDYMDAATYGTIVHKIVENLYTPYNGKEITKEVIDRIKASDIQSLIYETIDDFYHKGKYKGKYETLPGESRVIGKIVYKYIEHMLQEERAMTPFVFSGAEFGGDVRHWEVAPGLTINFKMSIDRIDRIGENQLRFIDYKTGGDKLSVGSIENLFSPKYKDSNDAMLQLLMYSFAYCDLYKECYDGDMSIKPMVYRFLSIATDGIQPLSINKKELTNHNDYRDEFIPRMQEMFNKIFEEQDDFPFVQTDEIENCKFCPFLRMCGRTIPSNY